MIKRWRIFKCPECDVASYYDVATGYIKCDNCGRDIKIYSDRVKRYGYDEN